MAKLWLELDEDASNLWRKWKKKLGFITDSLFIKHLLGEYENTESGNSAYLGVIPQVYERKEPSCSPFSEESDQVNSGQSTPVLDNGYHADKAQYKTQRDPVEKIYHKRNPKKQKGFVGLESVVRRLHKAKGENSNSDGRWKKEGKVDSGTSSPDLDPDIQIKVEVESDNDSSYMPLSPKIIPHTVRTVAPEEYGVSMFEGIQRDTDTQVTLRTLLERPPISSPFRWNSEVPKTSNTISSTPHDKENETLNSRFDSPEISDSSLKLKQLLLGNGEVDSIAHSSTNPPFVSSNSVALDSLVRLAAQAKRDEDLKEKEQMVWKSMEQTGINVKELKNSFNAVSQSRSTVKTTETVNGAPLLKEILQSYQKQNFSEPSADSAITVKEEPTSDNDSFEIESNILPSSSARSALQHLAQMKDNDHFDHVKIKHGKSKAEAYSSSKRGKGTKTKKAMLRQMRGGVKTRRRKRHLSTPTVKVLLGDQRTHKSQHAKTILQRAPHKGGGKEDTSSPSASQMLLSITTDFMSDNNLMSLPAWQSRRGRSRKPSKWQPNGKDEKKAKRCSKTTNKVADQSIAVPHRVSEPIAASQVIRLLAEKGTNNDLNSDLTVTPTSINSSASEVMKLLASKQFECDRFSSTSSTAPVPLKPQSEPNVKSTFTGKTDNLEDAHVNFPQPLQSVSPMSVPLNLMFMSPPVQDSSRAFSLMKQLITKSST